MSRRNKSASTPTNTPASRDPDAAARSPGQASQSGPARQDVSAIEAGLYIVATPIGNARDISLRALDVLGRADVVACEDSRVSGRLLTRYGIKSSLTAYHDHNAQRVRPKLIKRLKMGEIVALISDAGTPLISDPGFKLVALAREQGIAVFAVPGASALLAALSVAGLPTDRFLFAGFAPPKAAARDAFLRQFAALDASLVFYESPRRLALSLAAMAALYGAREAVVARELTKLHEEVRRAPLGELAQHYADNGAPKGEVVIVVAPPAEVLPAFDDGDLEAALEIALESEPLRAAVDAVTELSGRRRREVYAKALALRKQS